MNNYLEIAEKNQNKAHEIIKNLEIVEIWQSVGARVNLVGSLRMGLLMKHLDIDFHIYTPTLDITTSFDAISQLAQHPFVKRIEYVNLIDTAEKCIEWHLWYQESPNSEVWQIDMIHILEGSFFDGYFEKVAQRISDVLTHQEKQTILRLKYETPETVKIIGVEYYRAVLEDGIAEYDDLVTWLKKNPSEGVLKWIP